ncbi:MAG: DNA-directed DNA polymerase [Candidatus Nanoarchaeia archaeon]|jgi:DNA polymerase elongation subunit (family B)
MKFTLTDIDYNNGIRLFGDGINGERVVIKDDEFKPFFYTKEKPDKLIGLKIDEHEVISFQQDDKGYKVIVNQPNAVPIISHEAKTKGYTVFERDIHVTQRYLIEKELTMLEGVDSENKKKCNINWMPKALAIDIETTNKKGVPDPAIDEVIMISLWDNNNTKKVLVSKNCNEKNCEGYKDEKTMLEAFNKIIMTNKPNIIITYNGDMFDWPFLRQRMKNYNIERKYGYDGSSMTVIKRANGASAKIKGLAHIDLYLFVSKILQPQLKTSTLDLNSVAQELIGMGKNEMDWEEFYKKWNNNDLKKITEYSLKDAEVTYELFDKLKPIMFELSKLVNQPLYDTVRSSYSSLVENYLINRSKELKEIIPPRPKSDDVMARMRTTFVGGYVHEPKAGVFKNIAIVDFRSLYPTIIVSYNIGPSTINKKGIKVKVDGRTHEFGQKEKGFIPIVVKDLVETRAKIKKELKKNKDPLLEARSYAVKTITNATYGYLSYPRSRWYCFDCSESITALGRQHIKEVISKAEKEGFGVIYGDTDSAFLTLGDKKKVELKKFMEQINKELPGIMELELEHICPQGLFVGSKKGERGIKKRYALLDEDGKLIIKGFEFVRGDWSNISKTTQYKVFNALLKDDSKEKAVNEVRMMVEQLRNNKIPLKDLIIRTQLTKNINDYKNIGPHVAVAKRLINKGYPVTAGTMIDYVVAEGKGLIRDKAKTINEMTKEQLKPDAEYYIHHQLIPAVDRVLEAIDVGKDEFEIKKQKGLKDFL